MLRRPTTCFIFLMITCFLATWLSFSPVIAEEGIIKATVKKKEVETSQENSPNSSQENQPQISINSSTYDAGEVWEGDTVSHSFTVKNTGTAVLNIKSVKPG